MGLNQTEAIVLRTYNLAEADKIAVLLTRDVGVLRGVARGARRLKSRFGAGLEPFTILDLTFYEKEGRELASLRSAEIIFSSFGLAERTEMVSMFAYMSEMVMEFAPPLEPNEKLFRMVRAVLLALKDSPEQYRLLVRYFEIWTLKLSGFLPELRSCVDCSMEFGSGAAVFFDVGFRPRCPVCSQKLGTPILGEAYNLLRQAQRMSPSEFALMMKDSPLTQLSQIGSFLETLIGRALEKPLSRALNLNPY